MKTIITLLALVLTACNRTSSPEGRMSIKIEAIQQQLDDLKKQNALILDSLGKMNQAMRMMKR